MDWYRMSKSALHSRLLSMRPAMAEAAQKVYDGWLQDEDDDLCGGGICQDIADAIADTLLENGVNVYIMESQVGEQHVWVIAYGEQDGFHIDIPHGMYETGSGYSWNKIPDVRFDETDVLIQKADEATLGFVRNEM